MSDFDAWLGDGCVRHSAEWVEAEEQEADMATDTLPAPEDRSDWIASAAAPSTPATYTCVSCHEVYPLREMRIEFGYKAGSREPWSIGYCVYCLLEDDLAVIQSKSRVWSALHY